MTPIEKIQKCEIVGDRVVVRQQDPTQVSRGGILIPQVAARRINQGTVIKSNAPEIPPGREVLYSPFGGTPVRIDEQDFLVLDPQDILLVLWKEEEK